MGSFLCSNGDNCNTFSYVAATGSNGGIVPAAAPAGKLAGVPTTNFDTGSGTGGTGATGGSASDGTSGGATGGSGTGASGTAAAGPTSIDGGPGGRPTLDASGAIIVPDHGGTVVGDDSGVDVAQRAANATADSGAGAGGVGSLAVATRTSVILLGLFMLPYVILLYL
ncbi:hypothetical protein RvY_17018 [Ramazzottius varieornatus]|uniref:Uncharacterized protein n=1 Tax=Ramazzottius varieornatus TaxID=947166 RepID=A0A1D1W331_RAMVA|nr:hypothetical protein RvY_17018 [Ramazzottius varieornatus]